MEKEPKNNEEYLLRYIENLELKVKFLEQELCRVKSVDYKPNAFDYHFWHESQNISTTLPKLDTNE